MKLYIHTSCIYHQCRVLSRILSLGGDILKVTVGGGPVGIGRSLLGGSGGIPPPHPEKF